MKERILIFGSVLFLLVSCKPAQEASDVNDKVQIAEQGTRTTTSSSEHALNAVLWQQNAAEYEALCHQAYNTAIAQLQRNAESGDDYRGHPSAIIMDLDETVLDNSPYNAQLILENQSFSPESWSQWVNKANADLVPGAKRFIDFAKDQDIHIIYISNRTVDMKEATMLNLQERGIDVNPEDLLLKEKGSGKVKRREIASQEYQIIMLIGDNIADFSNDFEEMQREGAAKELVESSAEEFGRRYIILPNPMYGGWMDGIKDNEDGTDETKGLLKGY